MAATRRNRLLYRPLVGERCEIASWKNTAEGWKATTVRGVLLGQDVDHIYVRVNGMKVAFDRPMWEHVID